jgi:hypothetical protein
MKQELLADLKSHDMGRSTEVARLSDMLAGCGLR